VIEIDRERSPNSLASQSNSALLQVSQRSTRRRKRHDHQPIPATQNEAWGFWGTMNDTPAPHGPGHDRHLGRHHQPLESVRIFLDSRHGRHFADDVQNGLHQGQALQDAINAATQRWMGWTIGRQTSKQYGIPRGLPYLTAL
jgi:hypothetical protein